MDLFNENTSYLLYIGCAVFFVICAYLAFAPSKVPNSYNDRLKRVRADGYGTATMNKILKGGNVDIRKHGKESGFDVFLRRITPKPELLQSRLDRTGKPIRIIHFFIATIMMTIVLSAILITKNIPPVLAVLGAFILGYKIIDFIISFMVKRRTGKFIKFFPDAIDMMVRGIKSGLPLTQTIQSISYEMDGPVGVEFGYVANGIKLGVDMNDALLERSRILNIPELKFFCIALSIQQETGGNLSETLTNLSTILRKRKQVQMKIKAMSSEAKASAIIIGSLPFIMYMILKIMSPEYVEPLFNDPRGIKLAMFGLFMIGLGAFVMNRIVSFEI